MKHVGASIQAYVSGDLDPGRSEEVAAHLAGCPECRGEFEKARQVWDLLGLVEDQPEAVDSIWTAVRERTTGLSEAGRDWFFGRGPWMRSVLAAGAVAAGLMCGVLLPAGQSSDASPVAEDEEAWLFDATWLSDFGGVGLDDIILGVETAEQENES